MGEIMETGTEVGRLVNLVQDAKVSMMMKPDNLEQEDHHYTLQDALAFIIQVACPKQILPYVIREAAETLRVSEDALTGLLAKDIPAK